MNALNKPPRIAAFLALVALLLCALPGDAEARDLRERFGIGFNNNFSSFSSLSLKLGLPAPRPTLNIQVQALVGFSISALAGDDSDPLSAEVDQFFAGGRVLLPILAEDNLNVYGGFGGGYVRQSEGRQLFRGQAVLGVEFFFFGLDNLGCSAEFGLKLDIAPGLVEVETNSGSSASVGVHYYF